MWIVMLSLINAGVDDFSINYSVPDIQISDESFDASIPRSIVGLPAGKEWTDDDLNSAGDGEKKPGVGGKSWNTFQGLLNVAPLFRRRSGSDSDRSRRYRAMSADVLAMPSSAVQSLRFYYTGRSQFYDEPAVVLPKPKTEIGKPNAEKRAHKSAQEVVNPHVLQEIAAFEKLIADFFRSKRQPAR